MCGGGSYAVVVPVGGGDELLSRTCIRRLFHRWSLLERFLLGRKLSGVAMRSLRGRHRGHVSARLHFPVDRRSAGRRFGSCSFGSFGGRTLLRPLRLTSCGLLLLFFRLPLICFGLVRAALLTLIEKRPVGRREQLAQPRLDVAAKVLDHIPGSSRDKALRGM